MTQAFWRPQPIKPTLSSKTWVARLLCASLFLSGAGWAVYGVFAFAFDDIKVIGDIVQSVLVIVGSALIVIGAEMNSAPTGVAVFHKVGKGQASLLDWMAFFASLIGSLMSAWITFSIRQVLLGETGWRQLAMQWGPLIAGMSVALDYYSAIVELGLLKSDYEIALREWVSKMEQWRKEEQLWNADHGIVPAVDRSDWPQATVGDFRHVLSSLNGNRNTLTKDTLPAHLAKLGRIEPSPSTIDRWFREEMRMEAE